MGLEQGQDQQRCLDQLNRAIAELGGEPDPICLTRTSELIIQTMTGPWRFFHTPEHIFEVGGSGDGVEVLAALFHDLVYVQVDQGVSVNISAFISPFVKEVNGQLVIRDRNELPPNQRFELVLQVFGFKPGQGLVPTAGQNEFLSAVIAAECLYPALPDRVIAEIAACIEATIPFRGTAGDGTTPGERLYQRLRQISETQQFGWSAADLSQIVRRAIRLANRDVENFAYPDPADFLDNTWNLLPETNHDLANANSYTVYGYRMSLQKMESFMHFLKPELVFQRFEDEPDAETYRCLVEHTGRNLEVARLYLGSKLLSIAIIEALSRRLGRNIPLATMMGELPSLDVATAQLENFLPLLKHPPHQPQTPLEKNVLKLLEEGRYQASSYDIKNSPVATYIIKSVGFDAGRSLLHQAKAFFKGELSAEEFLALFERPVIEPIVDGVAAVFESRKTAIRQAKVGNEVHS
jgi:hypothetical protein